MTTPKHTQPKLLHIFRAGKHVTAAGEEIEFTQADLAATAAAYDPSLHEAPFVVGHPKTDDPAFGWGKSLEVQGDDLFVVPDQVNAEFAEMVTSGAFKKRSAKFYRPTDSNNPKPGVWYLQHVGFLGAAAPAVKGLKPVQFADGGDLVEIEFSNYSDQTAARMFRRLREWIIGKFGQDEADKALSPWDVDFVNEQTIREEAQPAASPAFSQQQQENPVDQKEADALRAENERLTKLNDENVRKAALAATATRHAEHVIFSEGLAAKLPLPLREIVVGVLDHLTAQTAPVEFGEGEKKAPLADTLKTALTELPDRVEFNETATKGKAGEGEGSVEFSAPAGHSVSADRAALHAKALSYQKTHPGTDYLAAVRAVE